MTPEERAALRARARLTRYIRAAIAGREPDGAEAELSAACGCPGEVPLELFESRATADAPGAGATNLHIVPAVFEASLAPRLGVSMPLVESGLHATATITAPPVPSALGKGSAITADAASFAVASTGPHRVSARLEVAVEDVAAVGDAAYEVLLREALTGALGDALDSLLLRGSGSDGQPRGLVPALSSNYSEPLNSPDFGWSTLAELLLASAVDGFWARGLSDLTLGLHPDRYRSLRRGFASSGGAARVADYYSSTGSRIVTSARWPADPRPSYPFIIHRRGRPVRAAEMPVWSHLSIEDTVTQSASGVRAVTVTALVGDVVVRHRRAYLRGDLLPGGDRIQSADELGGPTFEDGT